MADDELSPTRLLDEALLRVLGQRLGSLTRIETVSVFPITHPESVIAQLDTQYYPESLQEVTLECRAYLDGSFHITYKEDWGGQRWLCRWDRHDNPHNSRDHFHQPPDATTADAVNRTYPADILAVLDHVLEYLDERLGDVWDRD